MGKDHGRQGVSSGGVPWPPARAEDAYGPDELIEELADLSEQAVSAGEKGMRNASSEKELPSFARDAVCMGRLGEFYVRAPSGGSRTRPGREPGSPGSYDQSAGNI